MRRDDEKVRVAVSVLVVVAMLVWWRVSGCDRALFPEVGALSVGLLMKDKRVWRVGKLMCLCVMTLSSVIGVGTEILVSSHGVLVTSLASFVITGAMLVALRSQLTPALATALLPTVVGIGTWDYVGYVALMVAVVLLVQWLLEVTGQRSYRVPIVMSRAGSDEVFRFKDLGILAMCAAPLCVAAWLTGWVYLIAPPVLVTMVEFSYGGSGFRQRAWQVLFMLLYGAGAGSAFVVICSSLGLGMGVAGLLIVAAVMFLFSVFKKSYAPAFSVALLSLLVGSEDIWTYPIQVVLGGAYSIVASSIPTLVARRG